MVSYATHSCLSHLALVLVTWLLVYTLREEENAFSLVSSAPTERTYTPMCHSVDLRYVQCTVLRTNSKWLVSYATPTLVLVTWLLS